VGQYKGKPCIPYSELLSLNQEEELEGIVESAYYKEIKQQLIVDGINDIRRLYLEK
jgi:hypothetical protein